MFAITFDLIVAETSRRHPKNVSQAYNDIATTLEKFGFCYKKEVAMITQSSARTAVMHPCEDGKVRLSQRTDSRTCDGTRPRITTKRTATMRSGETWESLTLPKIHLGKSDFPKFDCV